jgi:hypothetical protein
VEVQLRQRREDAHTQRTREHIALLTCIWRQIEPRVKNNRISGGKLVNEALAFTALECIVSEDWGLNIAIGLQVLLIQYLPLVYILALDKDRYSKSSAARDLRNPNEVLSMRAAKLTDFRMSVIKPQIPKWLFVAWKRVADDRRTVMPGWSKCSLRAAFEDKKEEVLRDAQLAMSDPDHHLYPLFPTGDCTNLPSEALEGQTEPEVGQAGDPEENAVAGDESGEDTQTTEGVRALLAAQPAAGEQTVCKKAVRSGDVALFPIFTMAACKVEHSLGC